VAHGTPWKLVATGEEVPGALALRWDKESEPRVESLAAKSGLLVAWHSFGKFEPDDDVIFGVAPAEAVAVTQVPGYGLPETEVDVIDVPGANWHAFVFASYAAIGVVTAGDARTPSSPQRLKQDSGTKGRRRCMRARTGGATSTHLSCSLSPPWTVKVAKREFGSKPSAEMSPRTPLWSIDTTQPGRGSLSLDPA
jgi:hypothetical protein